MRDNEQPSPLNPGRFAQAIKGRTEFVEALPQNERFATLPPPKRQEYFQKALASSALAISEEREQKHGSYDLDANLFKLIGSLHTFHTSLQAVNKLRRRYPDASRMSPGEQSRYYEHKDRVSDFNHTLHEVINAGASRFNFNELLRFMTAIYAANAEGSDIEDFHQEVERRLVGMRNEMGFEEVLINGGIDYELGDLDDDAVGGDFIIEGVPIDVKASEKTATRAKERAREAGYDPNTIIWSHLRFSDFEGKLTLPRDFDFTATLATLKPELDTAIISHQRSY